MSPELSRRLGRALGLRPHSPAERAAVVAAAEKIQDWEQLPPKIRDLVTEIEQRATGVAG